jgi:predicted nuclease of predicted toxin-antitoxin system
MPRSAIGALTARGHQVEFARDAGLGAASDARVAERAQEINAALLSRDLDFADIRKYPPDRYGGIVVFRLPDHFTASEIVAVLERFLEQAQFIGSLPGRLAIVDDIRVRFRPPLT